MKKTLSLVLVLTLVLSLCTVFASAGAATEDGFALKGEWQNLQCTDNTDKQIKLHGKGYDSNKLNETGTVCTTAPEGYNQWKFYVLAELVEGTTYKVLSNAAFWTPDAPVSPAENQILVFVHGAASISPEEAAWRIENKASAPENHTTDYTAYFNDGVYTAENYKYKNWKDYVVFQSLMIDDTITLYNVDLTVEDGVDYENAYMVVNQTEGGDVTPPPSTDAPTVPTVISTGATYTTTAPNRGEGNSWNDDGKRLTDGYIPEGDQCGGTNADVGGTAYCAGWQAVPVEVVVDLGEAKDTNTYNLYYVSGNWGIGTVDSVQMFTSVDGETFTEVGTPTDALHTGDDSEGTWSVHKVSFTSEEAINARYVKFVADAGDGHVWIGEVEVLANVAVTDNLGDAGIYAIAGLALVALFGTAVVIKKRA